MQGLTPHYPSSDTLRTIRMYFLQIYEHLYIAHGLTLRVTPPPDLAGCSDHC